MDNKELTNKIMQMAETDAEVKSDIKHIIKTLEDHITWEDIKYKEMDDRFACKATEVIAKETEVKLNKLPDKLVDRFAEKWVENWTKAVAFTVVGSVTIAVVLNIII